MAGAEKRHDRNAGGHAPPALAFDVRMLSDAKLRPVGDPVVDPLYERVDLLIRRLFAAGLDLHGALGHIHEHVDEAAAVRLIQQAITGLDEVIKEFRGVVLDLWPPDRTPADALPEADAVPAPGGVPGGVPAAGAVPTGQRVHGLRGRP